MKVELDKKLVDRTKNQKLMTLTGGMNINNLVERRRNFHQQLATKSSNQTTLPPLSTKNNADSQVMQMSTRNDFAKDVKRDFLKVDPKVPSNRRVKSLVR